MKRKVKIKYLRLLLIIIAFIFGFIWIRNVEKKIEFFSNLENKQFEITKFFVYGTNLNFTANFSDINYRDINSVSIELTDMCGKNYEYQTECEMSEDNKMSVKLSEYINQGICLENIENGDYGIFLKIKYRDGSQKYYSIDDNFNEAITYYTFSNNKPRVINIEVANYNGKNYIKVNSKNEKTPESVYDISIDPGHGGSDPGAVSEGNVEAELALKYSLELKKKLEEYGYKVLITRDGSEDTSENSKFNVYSVYDREGRVNIVGKSKAKYNFSIHLNSLDTNTTKGVEIYAPGKTKLDFAKSLADNIVNKANTVYSGRTIDKVLDGVYVRNYTEEEILESANNAKKNGYRPYNITESTPYLYMIREVGGSITNAYVDGRNRKYGTNEFYNSNIGVESYLIELGYINNKEDLNNILINNSKYIDALAEGIAKEINNIANQ